MIHPPLTGSSIRLSIIALAFLLLSATGVRAQTTYCYTGNDFTSAVSPYTTSDSVSGCVTLSTALPANTIGYISAIPNVTSISFTDGQQTITAVSDILSLSFATSSGMITEWDVYLTPTNADIRTYSNSPGTGSDFAQHALPEAFNNEDPGTWATTPEPSSLTLWLLGILAVGIMTKRARRVPKLTRATP